LVKLLIIISLQYYSLLLLMNILSCLPENEIKMGKEVYNSKLKTRLFTKSVDVSLFWLKLIYYCINGSNVCGGHMPLFHALMVESVVHDALTN
jgi:hypothetical protein